MEMLAEMVEDDNPSILSILQVIFYHLRASELPSGSASVVSVSDQPIALAILSLEILGVGLVEETHKSMVPILVRKWPLIWPWLRFFLETYVVREISTPEEEKTQEHLHSVVIPLLAKFRRRPKLLDLMGSTEGVMPLLLQTWYIEDSIRDRMETATTSMLPFVVSQDGVVADSIFATMPLEECAEIIEISTRRVCAALDELKPDNSKPDKCLGPHLDFMVSYVALCEERFGFLPPHGVFLALRTINQLSQVFPFDTVNCHHDCHNRERERKKVEEAEVIHCIGKSLTLLYQATLIGERSVYWLYDIIKARFIQQMFKSHRLLYSESHQDPLNQIFPGRKTIQERYTEIINECIIPGLVHRSILHAVSKSVRRIKRSDGRLEARLRSAIKPTDPLWLAWMRLQQTVREREAYEVIYQRNGGFHIACHEACANPLVRGDYTVLL